MRIIQRLLRTMSLGTLACVAVACTASGTLETGFRPASPTSPASASAPQQEPENESEPPTPGPLESAATSPKKPTKAAKVTKAKKATKGNRKHPRGDDELTEEEGDNVDRSFGLGKYATEDKDPPKAEEELPESGRHIGDKCDDDDQCASHGCNGGHCDHQYGHTVPKGDQCDYDNQCDSNHCYDDTCQ
jgi:hypothetical protein